MTIETVPIGQLKPAEYNPRQATEAQHKHLTESLKRFGMVDPIIVNKHPGRENVVVGGHFRLRVAKDLGWTEVPVVFVDLDEDREKELNLRLNKNTGEWDWELLANFDVDLLKDIGFDEKELMKGLGLQAEVTEDEAPEPPAEPKSKLGDLYQLGNHRLLCGDATKKEDVERLMDGQKADMVFTDPPYGMNLDTDYSRLPGTSSKYDKVIGDDRDFDASVLFQIVDCPIWYLWGADYYCYSIPRYKDGSYIVWSKSQSENENKVIGSRFELCWTLPSQKKDVWFERSINQSSERTGEHPTQKPVALAARAINKSQSQTVLDFFGGSGSTLIACEQLNRKCYMMEIDSRYVDVIISRWCAFTGNYNIIKNDQLITWSHQNNDGNE